MILTIVQRFGNWITIFCRDLTPNICITNHAAIGTMSPSAPTNHIGFQHSHRFLISMLISRKDNLIFLTKYDLQRIRMQIIHILLFVYLLQLMFKFKSSVFPNIWHTSILDYLPNAGKKRCKKWVYQQKRYDLNHYFIIDVWG